MLLAFWCHLLFFAISMHKILNNFCLPMEQFFIIWAGETKSESDRLQSKTLFQWLTVGMSPSYMSNPNLCVGFQCHLGSWGISAHLLWQKAPQVLCHICQPHVGVSDNILIWLRGLTLRQSNAIQRVFHRTISVLESEWMCVYANICM